MQNRVTFKVNVMFCYHRTNVKLRIDVQLCTVTKNIFGNQINLHAKPHLIHTPCPPLNALFSEKKQWRDQCIGNKAYDSWGEGR